jgi:hypothetical protein
MVPESKRFNALLCQKFFSCFIPLNFLRQKATGSRPNGALAAFHSA